MNKSRRNTAMVFEVDGGRRLRGDRGRDNSGGSIKNGGTGAGMARFWFPKFAVERAAGGINKAGGFSGGGFPCRFLRVGPGGGNFGQAGGGLIRGGTGPEGSAWLKDGCSLRCLEGYKRPS